MERGLLVGDCRAYREFHTWQRVANCLASPCMVDPHWLLLTRYVGTPFPENKPGQAQFHYLPSAKWQDKESKTPGDFFFFVTSRWTVQELKVEGVLAGKKTRLHRDALVAVFLLNV